MEAIIPQLLKPDLFAKTYVRAEARTLIEVKAVPLQNRSFSERCEVATGYKDQNRPKYADRPVTMSGEMSKG